MRNAGENQQEVSIETWNTWVFNCGSKVGNHLRIQGTIDFESENPRMFRMFRIFRGASLANSSLGRLRRRSPSMRPLSPVVERSWETRWWPLASLVRWCASGGAVAMMSLRLLWHITYIYIYTWYYKHMICICIYIYRDVYVIHTYIYIYI